VDATCDPVTDTRLYQTQTRSNPTDATLWKDYTTPQTRGPLALMGLQSGGRKPMGLVPRLQPGNALFPEAPASCC